MRDDAIVVGAGPNGLAAAITLARAGRSVWLVEARAKVGGGTCSAELTLPGFVHDVCSAIHPLAVCSPLFRSLPLADHGLEWVYPPAAVAHPFDDGTAVTAERSLEATAAQLGRDGPAYRRLLGPMVAHWDRLAADILGPLPLPPRHPVLLSRFGLRAIWPVQHLAKALFRGERARALLVGMAAHSAVSPDRPLTAAFGVVVSTLTHAVGWPMPRGGSQNFADALAGYLRALGGEIVTGWRVASVDELPPARAVLFDVAPRELLRLAGHRFTPAYRRALSRFRHGPGAFKIDWALEGPIPWRAPECARAATVHVGGTLDEIVVAERAAVRGEHPERPFVLVVQHTPFDPTRAPKGKHTAWAYCHVPLGSACDMTERIEAQIERFAPGFRERIAARHTISAAAMEAFNPNYVGGDIMGGAHDLWQLYARPTARLVPYSTPARGIYLCSASTPPGAGVHGMCGHHAARAALVAGG